MPGVAAAAVQLMCLFYWGVMRRLLALCTDVSGKRIGPVFKGRVVLDP